MFPIKEFEKRFREILSRMDEIREEAEGDAAESMDELNAEFEDALFGIECIDQNVEDWREEFEDWLDEFEDLCGAYSDLTDEIPELTAEVQRFTMAVQLAKQNLSL